MYQCINAIDDNMRNFERTFILMNRYETYRGDRDPLYKGHYIVSKRVTYYDGKIITDTHKMSLLAINRLFKRLDHLDTSDHVSDMIRNRPLSMRIEYPNCCGFQDHLTSAMDGPYAPKRPKWD